jgi:hypothetical protein
MKRNMGMVSFYAVMTLVCLVTGIWMPIDWYHTFPYEGFPWLGLVGTMMMWALAAICFCRGMMWWTGEAN